MNEKQLQKDFVAMLSRSESMLYRVCMMYTDRSVEQVNDLYQEIVCCLWKYYPGFRGESKETTWAWRVAVNVARRSLYKEKRRPVMERLPDELCETLAEEPADPLVERLYEPNVFVDLVLGQKKSIIVITKFSCAKLFFVKRLSVNCYSVNNIQR